MLSQSLSISSCSFLSFPSRSSPLTPSVWAATYSSSYIWAKDCVDFVSFKSKKREGRNGLSSRGRIRTTSSNRFSRILALIRSSKLLTTSSVITGIAFITRSNSKSSSSREFWGLERESASPMRTQSLGPTFSVSSSNICLLRAAIRFSWVERSLERISN